MFEIGHEEREFFPGNGSPESADDPFTGSFSYGDAVSESDAEPDSDESSRMRTESPR